MALSHHTATNIIPFSKIAFIALNPGGDRIPTDHGKESCESGSAYRHEIEHWKSPLQQQVRELFKQIAICLKSPDYNSLMDHSLMAYYIPFRSPNYKKLNQKQESRDFAFALWSHIMKNISPNLIICIDKITFRDMHKILTNTKSLEPMNRSEMPTGWGNYKASINTYFAAKKHVVLVRFPHLSRFKIFDRPISKPRTEEIVTEMTKFMR